MSTIAEAAAVEPSTLQALVVVLLTVAGGVAAAVVFRRGSIAGPERMGRDMPAIPWMMVVFTAAVAWLMVQAAYFAVRGALVGGITPTTLPATTSVATNSTSPDSIPLTAGDLAFLSTIPPALASVVLLAGAAMLMPGLLRRLGLGADALKRAAPVVLLGTLITYPLVIWGGIALEQIYKTIHFEHPTRHELLKALDGAVSPATRIAITIGAVICAPVFEELLFRGGLQTLIRRAMTGVLRSSDPTGRPRPAAWTAVLGTSVLFALIHELWMAPVIFLLSVCIGYAYERTANLWAAIGMHAVFNAANVVASSYLEP